MKQSDSENRKPNRHNAKRIAPRPKSNAALSALMALAAIFVAGGIVLLGITLVSRPLQTPPQVIQVTATRAPDQSSEIGSLFGVTPGTPSPSPVASNTPDPAATPVAVAPTAPFFEMPTLHPLVAVTVTPHPSGCPTYTVEDGDSLISVAELLGVPLPDLLTANGYNDALATALLTGDVLVVPIGGCGLPGYATPTLPPNETAAPPTERPTYAVRPTRPTARPASTLAPYQISIPSLNINLRVTKAVFVGVTWDFTRIITSAAFLEGLAMPGVGRNVVIGAHYELGGRKPGPFYRLHDIQPGADIIISYDGTTYHYIVESTYWVVPTDISPINQNVGDVLTLLTCDSYNHSTGQYDTRLIVRAVRVG